MATARRPAADARANRRATNVSLPAELVRDAKALDINVLQACEVGLAQAVKAEQARRWQEENRQAIAAHNAWVEKIGLPLARYRMF